MNWRKGRLKRYSPQHTESRLRVQADLEAAEAEDERVGTWPCLRWRDYQLPGVVDAVFNLARITGQLDFSRSVDPHGTDFYFAVRPPEHDHVQGPDAMSENAKKLAIGRFGVDFERIGKVLKSKGEDHLGGFEVHVKNVKGKLVVRVGEHGDTKIKTAAGGSRMDFVCKAPAGSIYRGTASIVAASRRLALIRTMDVPASDAPWNGYFDWYAGVGEIDGRPGIPHDKLRIGGLTMLHRHDPAKEKKEEVFPIGPFQGFWEIPCEHDGVLLFCIVDRPGQYFDNSGVCQVRVYQVN